MPGPIQAISFDAAGTLFRLADPVGVTYAAHAARHGLTLPAEALDRAFRASWKAAPAPHGPRETSSPPGPAEPDERERAWWRSLVEDTFQRAARETGGAPPGKPVGDRIFDDLFQAFADPALWRLYPEAPDLLDRLQGRYRLVVISNFDRRFHRIAEGLGLAGRFEAAFLSGEVGAAKPDPVIFQSAAAALQLDPGRILHVGDDPIADWEGARRAGFRAAELRRPHLTLETVLKGI